MTPFIFWRIELETAIIIKAFIYVTFLAACMLFGIRSTEYIKTRKVLKRKELDQKFIDRSIRNQVQYDRNPE